METRPSALLEVLQGEHLKDPPERGDDEREDEPRDDASVSGS